MALEAIRLVIGSTDQKRSSRRWSCKRRPEGEEMSITFCLSGLLVKRGAGFGMQRTKDVSTDGRQAMLCVFFYSFISVMVS